MTTVLRYYKASRELDLKATAWHNRIKEEITDIKATQQLKTNIRELRLCSILQDR